MCIISFVMERIGIKLLLKKKDCCTKECYLAFFKSKPVMEYEA